MPNVRPNTGRNAGGMKRPASTTELARIAAAGGSGAASSFSSMSSSSAGELMGQPIAQRRRLDASGTSDLIASLPSGAFPTSLQTATVSSLLRVASERPSTSSQQRYAESTRMNELPQPFGIPPAAAFRPNLQPSAVRVFDRPPTLAIAGGQPVAAGGSGAMARGLTGAAPHAYGRLSPANPRSRSSVASTSSDDNSNHSIAAVEEQCFCPCKTAIQGRQEDVANRRLLTEMRQLADAPLAGCQVSPREDSIWHWTAVIDGPPDTVYEGGTFFVELTFTDRYPFQAPKIVFLTRIYHCNINSQGKVCMDPISRGWNSCMTISTILQSLISLLYACNPKDALVPCIADQFLKYPAEYEKMARIWTQRYAQ